MNNIHGPKANWHSSGKEPVPGGQPSFGVFRDHAWYSLGIDPPVISVQALDGQLPSWALAATELEAAPDAEIVLVQSADKLANYRPSGAKFRFIFFNEALQGIALPDCHMCIGAPPGEFDIASEALAKLINGRSLMIGAELVDALSIARGNSIGSAIASSPESAGASCHGRAIVFNTLGQGDGPLVATLRRQLDLLAGAGFKGGLILVALVGPQDEEPFSLVEFDEFLTAAIPDSEKRSFLATASAETTRSGMVLFAFQ